MKEETFYQIALTCIPGVGSQTIKQLLAYCGSAKIALTCAPGKLRKIPGIGEKTIDLIRKTPFSEIAEAKLALAADHQVKFVFYNDEIFPARLRHCADAPAILYYRGMANFNASRIISIVGTRTATEYGKIMTTQIVRDLLKYDVIIVSGLAYGIDICAHKAALAEGIPTWAVIAGGHNKIYPAAHVKTCQEIISCGCVISEHLPNVIPEATNFPERNRIIAGISDATLVIEAKETGGALITAEIANSYDREVFAIPGPVGSASSVGCHNLIKRNEAHLATSAADIANLLGWDSNKPNYSISLEDFTSNELTIISLLREKEMQIDDISWKSGLTVSTLASLLLALEMRGWIKALPGKKFRFTPK